MKNHYSRGPEPEDTLEKMLGFGDKSIRKSYYPELQKTIHDLKQAEDKYYNIFRHALNGIFQFDPGGRLLDANPAFMNILGFASLEETRTAIGYNGRNVFENPEVLREILRDLQKDERMECKIARIRRADGVLIWASINAIVVHDRMKRVLYIEGYIEDVTTRVEAENALKIMTGDLERLVYEKTRELEEANQKLLVLSHTDGLTGIANRRAFDEVMAREWRRAARSGQYLAAAMLDIDYFKNFNDLYGHLAGDECLRQVAGALAHHARRAGDLAARYGGEEFILVLPGLDCSQATALAESIRKSVEDAGITHESSPFGRVTVSIGVAAVIPGEMVLTPENLVKTADDAMYCAKMNGRNQVSSFLASA